MVIRHFFVVNLVDNNSIVAPFFVKTKMEFETTSTMCHPEKNSVEKVAVETVPIMIPDGARDIDLSVGFFISGFFHCVGACL